MDELKIVLGSRIRYARERLNLSQKELAEAIGVDSHQIVSQMEKGERDIKAWELAKLAGVLKVEISNLLAQAEPEKEPVILWRQIPEKDKEAREMRFLKKCRDYFNLELAADDALHASLPSISVDAEGLDYQKVNESATNVMRELNLGQRPAASIEKVLEDQYSVKIWYDELGGIGSAASTVGQFGAAILMNSSQPPWRRNYSFAHELFHLLTWKSMPPESLIKDKVQFEQYEKFAEAFASALLLPADSIINEFKRRIKDSAISYTDLVDIAREFGVSTKALLYRLQRLNQVNKKAVETTLDDPNFRSIDRASMSGHWWNPPPMPERYVRLAFKAYQKGKVTRARLAEYLDTSLFDLGQVLLEYGFDENDDYETQMRTA